MACHLAHEVHFVHVHAGHLRLHQLIVHVNLVEDLEKVHVAGPDHSTSSVILPLTFIRNSSFTPFGNILVGWPRDSREPL